MGKSLKGKELGRGILQRKDGLYQGSFTDYFGKRRCVYGKTIREVSRKLDEAKHSNDIGLSVNSSDYILDEWFEFWIKTYKTDCRNTTLSDYKAIYYKHVSSVIGNIKLDKLTPLIIQKMIDNIDSKCIRYKVKVILKDMFKWGVKLKIIKENYMDSVFVKKYNSENNKRFLLEYEIELIKKYGAKRKIYPFFILGLNTGMRGGELAGLKWKDIDFENNIIHVRTTYVYKTSSVEKTLIKEDHSPKTKKGVRDIPLTKEARNILLAKKSQRYEDDEYVFKTRGNLPLPLSNVNKAFDLIIHTINKQEGIHLERFSSHAVRRTFATKAIKNGMNPKTLQYILGHSSCNITLDVYCQVSLNTIKEEMTLIEK